MLRESEAPTQAKDSFLPKRWRRAVTKVHAPADRWRSGSGPPTIPKVLKTTHHPLFRRNTLQVRGTAGDLWGYIDSVLNPGWNHKIPLQMRDAFQKQGFVSYCDVIEQDQVLVNLAHIADVGH